MEETAVEAVEETALGVVTKSVALAAAAAGGLDVGAVVIVGAAVTAATEVTAAGDDGVAAARPVGEWQLTKPLRMSSEPCGSCPGRARA